MNRILVIKRQLCGANEGEIPSDVSKLPLPPAAPIAEGYIFPTFMQMLEDKKKFGGLYSYEVIGGRRITLVADQDLLEIIFSPHEMGSTPGIGDAINVEMEKLAHAWFGIPRDIADLTRPSLDSVRKAIGPMNVTKIADKVGAGVLELFNSLGNEGTMDLVKIAHGTFWPVNQAMFGECTIGPNITPGADDWFHQFDEYIPQVTGGMPASMFDDMIDAANKIVGMFEKSINEDNHLNQAQCPVLHDRLAAVDINKRFDKHKQAQFMISLFWAPQANTLPMTWWVLAHILNDKRVKAKVEEEVRKSSIFRNAPDSNGHFPAEDDDLPYTRACMYEVLRMYIANLTHRKVARDFPLKVGDKWYRIPKNDMITSSSYITHYDPNIFPDPFTFRPERWLEKKYRHVEYWPFAHGKFSCSGKFLAQLEIPILVGLFFRDFDTELVDPMPPADWERVVASVRPVGWPYKTNCRVHFKRVKKQ